MRRSVLHCASAIAFTHLGTYLIAIATGCNSPSGKGAAPTASASAIGTLASTGTTATPATTDAGPAHSTGSASDAGPRSMPERPVPRESPTVRANMSPEIQMKAITYMAAMRAPAPDDPAADEPYAEEVRKKLEGIVRAADHGGAKPARGEVAGGGRQIDLYMHTATCDAQAPARYVSQGGYTLAGLRARGIFVVRCNGATVQCLQSTRDPGDILCTTAPRH